MTHFFSLKTNIIIKEQQHCISDSTLQIAEGSFYWITHHWSFKLELRSHFKRRQSLYVCVIFLMAKLIWLHKVFERVSGWSLLHSPPSRSKLQGWSHVSAYPGHGLLRALLTYQQLKTNFPFLNSKSSSKSRICIKTQVNSWTYTATLLYDCLMCGRLCLFKAQEHWGRDKLTFLF